MHLTSHWTIELPAIERFCIPDGYMHGCIRLDEAVTAFHITPSSKEPLRDAVLQIERLFRRECSFEDVELKPRDWIEDVGVMESWLLVASPGHPREDYFELFTAVGAASMYSGLGDDRWELGWAWLHPWERHRNYLRNLWPYLAGRYGSFRVPYPRALTPFVRETEHPHAGELGLVYLRGR